MNDAIRTGTGLLHGIPVALAVMEFGFMGGSMGSVVGEKLTRLIEYATQEGLTLLVVCTSGGARMQVRNRKMLLWCAARRDATRAAFDTRWPLRVSHAIYLTLSESLVQLAVAARSSNSQQRRASVRGSISLCRIVASPRCGCSDAPAGGYHESDADGKDLSSTSCAPE